MRNNMSKDPIINEILRIIYTISDKDYQRRIWIQGNGPECDSYDDAVCDFFQLTRAVLKEYKNYKFTNLQYSLLEQFYKEFERFVDSDRGMDLEQEFIDTPEWNRIIKLAQRLLQIFDYRR
jgi:hypothetical protein